MLERIKGLRGLLYRKMKESQIQPEVPGFKIKKPESVFEFPEMTDITQINITYPLIEPFAYANIKWMPEKKELMYIVVEPIMSEKEEEMLKKISNGVIELVEVELTSLKEATKIIDYLQGNIVKVIKEFGMRLTTNQYLKMTYYIYRNFVGFNEIEPLLQDPNIEDISCDGIATPVYIIHRKFGSIKTNIIFKDMEKLREFVVKLAERCGRYVSYAEPILAGTLADGSRVSATLAGDVATRGPVFTIRKFGEKPFSPIEQIKLGTASAEVFAYFWYLVESCLSMLITGGTATGKTSLLNSICMFIPPEAKIVSIEDTRELRFPHEHWVPGLARIGFGIPTPAGEKYGEVTLFDLLRESFRQNPTYVIVGETRGKEAYVMFQGMASGHSCMSTFHAGSIDTVIKRLTTPPIELSPSLIESLDVAVIMVYAKEKGKSARRVKEVVEVESVDPKTGEVKTRNIFKWNPINDQFERIGDSVKIPKIAATKGGTTEDALADIQRRKEVLEWMVKNGVEDYREVTKYVNMFYKEKEKLFELIHGKPIETPTKVERGAEKKVWTSILDLMGIKSTREKDAGL
jgi:flagellar protein FlaI